MTFLELCEKRFSARKFTDEPVSQEDLDYILKCTQLAPSAVNFQPWKFVIVESEEAKEKLRQCYNREWVATAPMYIVAYKNKQQEWVRITLYTPDGVTVAGAKQYLLPLNNLWGARAEAEFIVNADQYPSARLELLIDVQLEGRHTYGVTKVMLARQ